MTVKKESGIRKSKYTMPVIKDNLRSYMVSNLQKPGKTANQPLQQQKKKSQVNQIMTKQPS